MARPKAPPDPEVDAVFRKGQPHFGRAVAELRARRCVELGNLASRIGVSPEAWADVEERGINPAEVTKRKARAALEEMNGAAVAMP